MSKRRICLSLVAIFAVFVSIPVIRFCVPTAPGTRAELPGAYSLDSDLTHEDLILNPNGTFTQTIRIKATGEVLSSSGNWEYPLDTRMPDVVLDNHIDVLEWPDKLLSDYAKQTPSKALLGATYWFGHLYLGGEADSWPAYKKIK